MKIKKDRKWSEYPIGTRAHSCYGGHWERVKAGWKWCTGATFSTPGGDAVGKCIELPKDNEKRKSKNHMQGNSQASEQEEKRKA